MNIKQILLLSGVFSLMASQLSAQYFGQNKANYEQFNFKVDQTPNFEIYNYLKNQDALNTYANWAEQWHAMHQRVLKDTIYTKNPIILYDNHADFQQTNAVSGGIGAGTGGVTEAFKNRIIVPFAMSNQQSFHVLGHEMVHAFQYNMILHSDSTSLRNLANLPLWMVEGLAEYMSIGSVDAHTAMWMRDAVLRDDVPTLKDLQNPKYFPYRYGQAFWSFVAGLRGDEIIAPYFKATAMFGLEFATQQVLGMNLDNLSELWVNSVKQTYTPFLKGKKKEDFTGKELISGDNAGRINIAPVISPDGRYVIFLSEKDIFSIDLFLFDIGKGEIVRKVASSRRSMHIDDFNYIESAGTWSPDSKQFAFVGVSKGKSILIIKDVDNGRTVLETPLKGVPSFSNPNWSPDGRTIVVAGLKEGQVDLYTFDVRTKKVTQLTDSWYSELLPNFSGDGTKVIYSTDQLSMERGRVNGRWYFNLATVDMETREVEHIDIFPGADNLNPVIAPNGNILFLSNRDGYRNVYEYEATTGKVYQVTDVVTGVSGITHYAPAISVARKRERLVYTYFSNNRYNIYYARPDDFIKKEVDPMEVDFTAAHLPQPNPNIHSLVNTQLDRIDEYQRLSAANFSQVPYKSKFKLDYISSSGVGVGVGTSPIFGTTTGVAGGVDLLFSDILGNNSIFASASMNGEIYDFGAAVAYINRKSRINWGASISHIPFRSFAYRILDTTSLDAGGGQSLKVFEDGLVLDRIFEDRAGLFAFLPFTRTLRVEASASFAHYGFRREKLSTYYQVFEDPSGNIYIGNAIGQDRKRLKDQEPPGFNLTNVGSAFVGDNSSFGMTAPLEGQRFRLGVNRYFGGYRFTAPTIDYRIYRFFKPVGFAFRAYHYGRYGGNSDNIFPIYLGSPWYVRGYNTNNIRDALAENPNFSDDNLFGSKILVGNFEVRIPFTGPEQLALFKSGFLFSDLNFFFDSGVSWFHFDQFKESVSDVDGSYFDNARPIFSYGTSLRINLFGALILEPYYAFPVLKGAHPNLGLNILPGW
jgi:Tol biopolymer transport system component